MPDHLYDQPVRLRDGVKRGWLFSQQKDVCLYTVELTTALAGPKPRVAGGSESAVVSSDACAKLADEHGATVFGFANDECFWVQSNLPYLINLDITTGGDDCVNIYGPSSSSYSCVPSEGCVWNLAAGPLVTGAVVIPSDAPPLGSYNTLYSTLPAPAFAFNFTVPAGGGNYLSTAKTICDNSSPSFDTLLVLMTSNGVVKGTGIDDNGALHGCSLMTVGVYAGNSYILLVLNAKIMTVTTPEAVLSVWSAGTPQRVT